MSKQTVALVTGASRGIGRAIALEFADAGYDIAINYQSNQDAALAVQKEIQDKGRKAVALQADVGDFDSAQELVHATIAQLGDLHVLVNNAGITRDGMLVRMKQENFEQVIRTNLNSAFNCSRFAAAHMLKKRDGIIINISSIAGVIGNAAQANYSASKAGVIGLTKSMARELAPRGIRVNAIAPGLMQSDMTDAMDQAAKKKLCENIPLGRMGTPEDVAKAARYLLEASYVTGQVLCVDGGMVI